MRRSNNPKGRPRSKSILAESEINELLPLSFLSFSNEAIIEYLGVSNDTFYQRIINQPAVQKVLQDGIALRHTIIRIKQMEVAMNGNVQMLIHLGKSELGQIYNKESIQEIQQPERTKIDDITLRAIAKNIFQEK
ncbi:hypothetical protein [Rickettsiales endosymbiont of Stachyamoeba lipophora]|uniref:hypothetical protein n=1 Tax=Rickettsiales endosymbiont of Stachyamoeba lipophora TaxID=2486578 RepID=UPI000F64A442|nr:hypothetical protein [Rickettsiales endosymbiont of Stachyamoeba lipophora]AZL16341.1 hypothetical protein EF513_07370 [Rickettsiales endosymbiont of Stachyamoeba lipophora]